MAESPTISPPQLYFVNGTTCKVFPAIEASGTTGNKLLIAGVAGSVHRVIGWIAQGSTATAAAFRLRTAIAGSYLMAPLQVPGNTAFPADKQNMWDAGYLETVAGDALYVDVTAAALNGTFFCITYKA